MIHTEVEIAEVCETGSGGTPSRSKQDLYFGGPIPWVKSGELRESIITQTEESLTQAGLNESAAKLLPKDALLVALYGATVGRVGILGIEASTNQAVCHIIPDSSRVDRRYLFHALRSKVPYWLSQRVGGGQPNISQGVIKKTKIPLPPLSEQKRIAEILDRAESLRSSRRAALALLDELTQSIFLDMFGDPGTNSGGWPAITLGEVVRVVGGYAFKSQDFSEKGHPVIRISNLTGTTIDYSGIARIPHDKVGKGAVARIRPGDILMAMSGATTGKLGIVSSQLTEEVYQNQRVGNFRITDESRIARDFLIGFVKSRIYQSHLWNLAAGVAQPNVSGNQLESAVIHLPPLHLQNEYSERTNHIESIKQSLAKSGCELDQLFASLQHRAFRGEL